MKGKTFIKKAVSVFAAAAMSLSVVSGISLVGVNAEEECTCTTKCTADTYTFSDCTVCKEDYNGCTSTILGKGYCSDGDNHQALTWSLDINGTLTISGNGTMASGGGPSDFGWNKYKSNITTVKIESGVTSIGACAFQDYSNLTSVSIPNGVTIIGRKAFQGCASLENLSIPNGVTTIGDYAFRYCTSLKNVSIPNGVTSIGGYAFDSCTSLKNVSIPSSVTTVGDYVFQYCTSLERGGLKAPCALSGRIIWDEYTAKALSPQHTNCSHDDDDFIWGNKELDSGRINILFISGKDDMPDTMPQSVDGKAWQKVSGATELYFDKEVTSISATAFNGFTKVKKVVAPKNITEEEIRAVFPEDKFTNLTIELYATSYVPSSSGGGESSGGSSSTSRPSQPTVKGSDKTGWEGAVDAIDNAKDGDTVKVDMNNRTELPKNVLDEIKGKDVDLVLDMGSGIQWTINGTDVTDTKNINLGIRRTETGIPVNVINNITGEVETIQLDLEHEGDFGFKATLSIALGNENNGLTANLMYYNPETKGLEYTHSSVIKNGRADLEFSHASVWAIIIDDHSLEGETMGDLAAGEGVKAEEIILG